MSQAKYSDLSPCSPPRRPVGNALSSTGDGPCTSYEAAPRLSRARSLPNQCSFAFPGFVRIRLPHDDERWFVVRRRIRDSRTSSMYTATAEQSKMRQKHKKKHKNYIVHHGNGFAQSIPALAPCTSNQRVQQFHLQQEPRGTRAKSPEGATIPESWRGLGRKAQSTYSDSLRGWCGGTGRLGGTSNQAK